MAGDSNVSLKMQPGGQCICLTFASLPFHLLFLLAPENKAKVPFDSTGVRTGMWTGPGTQKSNCRWDTEDYLAFQTSQSFCLGY